MGKAKAKSRKKRARESAELLYRNKPCPTPFVSLLTGQPYQHLFSTPDRYYLLLKPTNDQIDLPASAPPFIESLFAKVGVLRDVLDTQFGIVVITEITTDGGFSRFNELKQKGKYRIPNSDYFFTVKETFLKSLIETVMHDAGLTTDPYSPEKDLEGLSDCSSPSTSEDESTFTLVSPSRKKANKPTPVQPSSQLASGKNAVPELSSRSALSCPPDAVPMEEVSAPAPVPAVQPKRRRFRFQKVDFDQLEVSLPPSPTVLTLLLRPSVAGTSLRNVHPGRLHVALQQLGTVQDIRSIRDGGLAIDFPENTPPAPLLAVSVIDGFKVSASFPRSFVSTCGVVRGLHPDVSDEEIRTETITVPHNTIVDVKRLARPGEQSWSVKLTFQNPILPEKILLFSRTYRVSSYKQRPLQCFKCAQYGHQASTCRSSQRCWTCSGPHDSAVCPSTAAPSCSNCGGPHPASDRSCRARAFQEKVVEVKQTAKVPFKAARSAVSKAAFSYAAALRKPAPPSAPTSAPTGNVFPNVAHPRPPTPPVAPEAQFNFVSLFQRLLAAVTAAAASNDFTSVIQQMAAIFAEFVPGAASQFQQHV